MLGWGCGPGDTLDSQGWSGWSHLQLRNLSLERAGRDGGLPLPRACSPRHGPLWPALPVSLEGLPCRRTRSCPRKPECAAHTSQPRGARLHLLQTWLSKCRQGFLLLLLWRQQP